MRVFVTGATGFVGSAVVEDLVSAGHRVLGLTRSDKGAARLVELGAEAHRGDLHDPDSLRRGAEACDGVIHTAFDHDFDKYNANCELDRRAIRALADGVGGSARPLVVTSGIGVLPHDGLLTEDSRPAGVAEHPRSASEEAAEAAMAAGGNIAIVRLPPSVHDDGDKGFVPMLIDIARRTGLSAYPRDGSNRWPAVHRRDAARVYRLALEKAAPGVRYHASAEEGVPFRDIATVIGRRLAIPVAGLAPEAAAAHFGWFTRFATMDVAASSARTRTALGWEPTGPGLIEDIDRAAYFEN